MSAANVRLAHRAIGEFNETRRCGPAFEACIHPDVSFEDEIGAYDTRDQVRDFLEGFADAIGGLQVEISKDARGRRNRRPRGDSVRARLR